MKVRLCLYALNVFETKCSADYLLQFTVFHIFVLQYSLLNRLYIGASGLTGFGGRVSAILFLLFLVGEDEGSFHTN